MAINPEVLIMICSPEQCASHWGCKRCRLLLLPGGVFVALLELEPTLPQPPPFCLTSIHGQWQESSFTCLMPLQSQTCHFALGLAILYKEDLQNWRMRGICPNATPQMLLPSQILKTCHELCSCSFSLLLLIFSSSNWKEQGNISKHLPWVWAHRWVIAVYNVCIDLPVFLVAFQFCIHYGAQKELWTYQVAESNLHSPLPLFYKIL